MNKYCDKFDKDKRVTVLVNTRDRHTEITLLMQSLRTQTFPYWDIVIMDESQTPIEHSYFAVCMINRIRQEKHHVHICYNNIRLGISDSRNKIIKEDYFNNPYVMRVDDDCILQPDYIERMLEVINDGYDIASGVTPSLNSYPFKRNINNVGNKINKKEIDAEGNILKYGDDCGSQYVEEKILPADEFRSNALMKKEVVKKIEYQKNLSPVGFREEGFFSAKAIKAGFKIGVDIGAVAWHLQTPSGGCRSGEYVNNVRSDDEYFRKWFKKIIKE